MYNALVIENNKVPNLIMLISELAGVNLPLIKRINTIFNIKAKMGGVY